MLDEGAKEPHKFFSGKLQAESLLPLCLEFKIIPKGCVGIALCSQLPLPHYMVISHNALSGFC